MTDGADLDLLQRRNAVHSSLSANPVRLDSWGAQGIFRPLMLGIAPAHLGAHLRIGIGPEAPEILGYRQGTSRRRQQLDTQGGAPIGNVRRFLETEHLLQAS